MIAINFVIFMDSEIIYKVNALDLKSIALSEIISNKKVEEPISIGEFQNKYGEFSPIAREQFKLRNKSWKKLPIHSKHGCLFTQRAFEQCTSEIVAKWKSKEFPASTFLNLTGGLGVDDWAWAMSGTIVKSVDIDPILNHISRYNFEKLNLDINRIDGDALNVISQINPSDYDIIYIDPDRRIVNKRAGSNPENFSPNILEVLKLLGNNFNRILIKLSPYTDIDWIKNKFTLWTRITVLQHGEDVKEILLLIDNNKNSKKSIDGFYIEGENNYCHWNKSKIEDYNFTSSTFFNIWVPSGMLNCMRLPTIFINKIGFESITKDGQLFITNKKIPVSLGKTYKILSAFNNLSLNQLKIALREENILSGGLRARNVKGLSSSEIQKKLGIAEGDQYQLFLAPSVKGKFNLWVTEK